MYIAYICQGAVCCLQAVDEDERKSITYTIVQGDTGRFSIDENSGIIVTRNPLDYEREQQYTLIVSTREVSQNDPQYTATVMVTVLVGSAVL